MVISEEVVERLPGLHGLHDGTLMAILANVLIEDIVDITLEFEERGAVSDDTLVLIVIAMMKLLEIHDEWQACTPLGRYRARF